MTKMKFVDEPLKTPDCAYPLPPYYFYGNGIILIYEIPYERIKDGIPDFFTPDPGRKKIWFIVNLNEYKNFHPVDDPKAVHTFFEAYYKFSVKFDAKLGDFPLKLYLNSEVGIASGIKVYGYPKYLAEMSLKTDKNGNVKGLIVRKDVQELKIELSIKKGLLAKITTLLANITAKSYIKKYTGNYLVNRETSEVFTGPTELTKITYKAAKLESINLREPLEWNILTTEEINNPKYAFILPELEALLDPPDKIKVTL